MATTRVRIVCISDTHNARPGEGFTLPAGDVLIHAGDLTNQGTVAELERAIAWIRDAEFAVKIVIAGNHDLSLDANYTLQFREGWSVAAEDVEACTRLLEAAAPNVFYLKHSAAEIHLPEKGVSFKVFGSPYSPIHGRQNWAFQYPEDEGFQFWEDLPSDADIVVTHTPPAGYCDTSAHSPDDGCPGLTKALTRVKPLLNICGHCHEGRGAGVVRWNETGDESVEKGAEFRTWEDPGKGSKKQSLFDLTGRRGGRLEAGAETAVVNAAITARSFGHGAKAFNKPIVVDVEFPQPCPDVGAAG